jgi:hypothetical protein
MKIFCWRGKRGECKVSVDRPDRAPEDDFFRDFKKGEIIPPLFTVSFIPPEGMEQHLPSGDEVKEMRFHQDMWGHAKSLPSYDKNFWKNMLDD